MNAAFRSILISLIIILAGCWLFAYRKLPAERDTILLKDNTKITGQIVKQDFGKFVVIEKSDNQLQVILWDQVKDIQLFNPPWYLRFNDAVEAIVRFGVIFGFIAFGVGLWQYAESQKWKRAEFLLKEIRTFEPNENVANVRSMLNQEEGDIYLYGRETPDGKEEKPVLVTREVFANALSNSGDLKRDHTPDERAIRSALDTYLSYLDHFNNTLESGLVRKKELKLYLEYWLDILGNPQNKKLQTAVRQKLWTYMRENGFTGAIRLLQKYGYAVS
jgi:hypothetical protein